MPLSRVTQSTLALANTNLASKSNDLDPTGRPLYTAHVQHSMYAGVIITSKQYLSPSQFGVSDGHCYYRQEIRCSLRPPFLRPVRQGQFGPRMNRSKQRLCAEETATFLTFCFMVTPCATMAGCHAMKGLRAAVLYVTHVCFLNCYAITT